MSDHPGWQRVQLLPSDQRDRTMPFRQFDAPTSSLLKRVRDDLFLDISESSVLSATEKSAGETRITEQLIAAAVNGERNPERLKNLALDGIDGI